jgi:hypothetical protein
MGLKDHIVRVPLVACFMTWKPAIFETFSLPQLFLAVNLIFASNVPDPFSSTLGLTFGARHIQKQTNNIPFRSLLLLPSSETTQSI